MIIRGSGHQLHKSLAFDSQLGMWYPVCRLAPGTTIRTESKIGDVAHEELVYYFLLNEVPYNNIYRDLLDKSSLQVRQGTSWYDKFSSAYIIANTDIEPVILETTDIIKTSVTYDSILVHVEGTASVSVEYSTDHGYTWNACELDRSVSIPDGFTSLRLRFICTTDGTLSSFGVCYNYDEYFGNVDKQIKYVTSEDMIYYFLLISTPFKKTFCDTFTHNSLIVSNGTATYNDYEQVYEITNTAKHHAILVTPNIIHGVDIYYRFLVHVEATAKPIVEYSTDDTYWVHANLDNITIVPSGFSSLKLRFIFTNDCKFYSYGIAYKYDNVQPSNIGRR